MGKRIVMVLPEFATVAHLTKDACSFLYYLATDCGWESAYAYFAPEPLHDAAFEQHCRLIWLGAAPEFHEQYEIARAFVRDHARDYDVIGFFNYGKFAYRLSTLAKRQNPAITTWSKLDMSRSGFRHFYDGTWVRRIKTIPERWKSADVDLFTVETRHYYDVLRTLPVFRGRIEYLPNGVFLGALDPAAYEAIPKDGSIVTVGRLGMPIKNTELLLDALELLGPEELDGHPVYLIGNCTNTFRTYADAMLARSPWMRDVLHFVGPVRDRAALYEYDAHASVICMTSRSESFCIAVAEAMYFGAYPVLTDYGPITGDMTDDGALGTIVSEHAPAPVAHALRDALRRAPAKADDIRRHARESFDYHVLVRRLDRYLRTAGANG